LVSYKFDVIIILSVKSDYKEHKTQLDKGTVSNFKTCENDK